MPIILNLLDVSLTCIDFANHKFVCIPYHKCFLCEWCILLYKISLFLEFFIKVLSKQQAKQNDELQPAIVINFDNHMYYENHWTVEQAQIFVSQSYPELLQSSLMKAVVKRKCFSTTKQCEAGQGNDRLGFHLLSTCMNQE